MASPSCLQVADPLHLSLEAFDNQTLHSMENTLSSNLFVAFLTKFRNKDDQENQHHKKIILFKSLNYPPDLILKLHTNVPSMHCLSRKLNTTLTMVTESDKWAME